MIWFVKFYAGTIQKGRALKTTTFLPTHTPIHVKTLLIKSTRYIFCVVTSHLVETPLPIVTFCLKLRIPPLQSLGEVIFELILWRDFIITIYLSKCKSTLYYQMNQILIVTLRNVSYSAISTRQDYQALWWNPQLLPCYYFLMDKNSASLSSHQGKMYWTATKIYKYLNLHPSQNELLYYHLVY